MISGSSKGSEFDVRPPFGPNGRRELVNGIQLDTYLRINQQFGLQDVQTEYRVNEDLYSPQVNEDGTRGDYNKHLRDRMIKILLLTLLMTVPRKGHLNASKSNESCIRPDMNRRDAGDAARIPNIVA